MKLTFLGHAAFKLEGSQTIYIDPFLTGNPAAAIKAEEATTADLVLVTHDHGDHIGDAAVICKQTGATLVSVHEIAVQQASTTGINGEGMNVGGTMTFGDVKVHMVEAQHSSESGHQTGFVVEMDGKTVYHAGDTGVFGDMKLIGEFFDIDVALLPIGDRYTMGPPSAAKAVELLGVKKVVPMHYNTFPIIEQDPEEFKRLVGDQAEVIILTSGEAAEI